MPATLGHRVRYRRPHGRHPRQHEYEPIYKRAHNHCKKVPTIRTHRISGSMEATNNLDQEHSWPRSEGYTLMIHMVVQALRLASLFFIFIPLSSSLWDLRSRPLLCVFSTSFCNGLDPRSPFDLTFLFAPLPHDRLLSDLRSPSIRRQLANRPPFLLPFSSSRPHLHPLSIPTLDVLVPLIGCRVAGGLLHILASCGSCPRLHNLFFILRLRFSCQPNLFLSC